MERWGWSVLILWVLAVGCTQDLKRIHTPDLLDVSDAEVKKWANDSPQQVHGLPIPRDDWQIHTSLQPRAALVDNSEDTLATSPFPESKDQYILVDLREVRTIRHVVQTHLDPKGHPRRFRIDVAGDHNFPYAIKHVGKGSPGLTVATFKRPVQCRFLRITLLEAGEPAWSVGELWVH